MSPEVIVVAVKAAVTVLTDKKLRNFVFGVILGVIIILFIPLLTILALFDGVQDMEIEDLGQMVMDQLDAETLQKLQHAHDTMLQIESAMNAAGYTGTRVSEAQVLFNLALYDHSFDSGFVDKLSNMGIGMLVIFVVIGIIILTTLMINKVFSE